MESFESVKYEVGDKIYCTALYDASGNPYKVNGYINDGYFIIGGGRSSGNNFLRNVFCVEANNAGTGSGGTGLIQEILDINNESLNVYSNKKDKTLYAKNLGNYTSYKHLSNFAFTLYCSRYALNSWTPRTASKEDPDYYLSIQATQHWITRYSGTIRDACASLFNGGTNYIAMRDNKTSATNYFEIPLNWYSAYIESLRNGSIKTFSPKNSEVKSHKKTFGGVNYTFIGPVNIEYVKNSQKFKNFEETIGTNLKAYAYKDGTKYELKYFSTSLTKAPSNLSSMGSNVSVYLVYKGNIDPDEIEIVNEYNFCRSKVFFISGNGLSQARIVCQASLSSSEDSKTLDVETGTGEKLRVQIFKYSCNQNGNYIGPLDGAKFKVTVKQGSETLINGVEYSASNLIKSNGNRYALTPYFEPKNFTTPITITISETQVPSNHKKVNNSNIVLTLTHISSGWKATISNKNVLDTFATGNGITLFDSNYIKRSSSGVNTTFGIKVKNVKNPRLRITLYKYAYSAGDKYIGALEGAKFSISIKQSGISDKNYTGLVTELSSSGNAYVTTGYFYPDTSKEVIVTIKETDVPNGYNRAIPNAGITYTLKWSTAYKVWYVDGTISSTNGLITFKKDSTYDKIYSDYIGRSIGNNSDATFAIKVKNKKDIPSFKLKVWKYGMNGGLSGAKFNVDFQQKTSSTSGYISFKTENITIAKNTYSGKDYYYALTGNITPPRTWAVKAVITETNVPTGYQKIGQIVIFFKYNPTKDKWEPSSFGGGKQYLMPYDVVTDRISYKALDYKIHATTANPDIFNIKIQNIKPTYFNLKKVNNLEEVLEPGTTATVTFQQNVDTKLTTIAKWYGRVEGNDGIFIFYTDKNYTSKVEFESGKGYKLVPLRKNQINATITEIESVAGFKITSPKTAIYKVNSSGNWESDVEGNTVYLKEIGKNFFQLRNDPKAASIDLVLKKTNENRDEYLSGAEVTVSIMQGSKKLATWYGVSEADGTFVYYHDENHQNIVEEDLIPTDKDHDVVVKIKEEKAPKGYKLREDEIEITYTYDSTHNTWNSSENESYLHSIDEIENGYTLKNDPLPTTTLVLKKANNKSDTNYLSGAEVIVTFTQAIDNSEEDEEGEVIKKVILATWYGKSDTNGMFKFYEDEEYTTEITDKKIIPQTDTPITAEIDETVVPDGYVESDTSIEYTLNSNKTKWTSKEENDTYLHDITTIENGYTLINYPEIPEIDFTLDKVNITFDDYLSNAEATVTFTQKIDGKDKKLATWYGVSNEDGRFVFYSDAAHTKIIEKNKVKPISSSDITATIKETKAPEGYEVIPEKKVTYTYDVDNTEWNSTPNDTNYLHKIVNRKNGYSLRNDPEAPPIEFTLKKTNMNFGQYLSDAETTVTFSQNNNSFATWYGVSDTDGNFVFYSDESHIDKVDNTAYPKTKDDIKVTIKETKAPKGYKLLEETITITYKLNSSDKWIATVSNTNYLHSISGLEHGYTLRNDPLKVGLDIIKVIEDKEHKDLCYLCDGESINFNVTFKQDGVTETKQITITGTDEKTPSVKCATWQPANFNDITVEIDETSKLDYYKEIKENIKLTISYDANRGIWVVSSIDAGQDNLQVFEETDLGYSINSNKYASENNEIEDKITSHIQIKVINKRIMNLAGQVWLDGQTGLKGATGPNGEKDEAENGMEGIKVGLFYKNKIVTKDAYENSIGENGYIRTDKNGSYKFENIEVGENYTVQFTYDGVNYIPTKYMLGKETVSTDDLKDRNYDNASKAKEDIGKRKDFNDQLKTINKDTTMFGNKLEYDCYADETNGVIVSKLKTTDDYNNHKNGIKVLPQYEMSAKSDNYVVSYADWRDTWSDSYALHINLGLVERKLDLELDKKVESAKLSINGKDTTYGYATKADETYEYYDYLGKKIEVTTKNGTFIYEGTDNKPGEAVLDIDPTDYKYRAEEYYDGSSISKTEETELKAEITYVISVKNRSAIEATAIINDYYDSKYLTLNNVRLETNEVNPQGFKYEEETKGTIAITGIKTAEPYFIYLTFGVNKNESKELYLKAFENEAEIVKYTTEGTAENPLGYGLVDINSAPGNLQDHEEDGKENDEDSDFITIKLSDETRKITGNVWNDGKDLPNGKIDAGEEGIGKVIVQLIEKSDDGLEYCTLTTQTDPNGNYTFDDNSQSTHPGLGFIPGNYIVRFIYGDYRTYIDPEGDGTFKLSGLNYGESEPMLKYNGQDYKGTINKNYYISEWYNGLTYNGDSKAADNEARRLETMAYAVQVDPKKGALLSLLNANKKFDDLSYTEKLLLNVTSQAEVDDKRNEVLKNTWMYADTPKINMAVDFGNDYKKSESSITVGGIGLNHNEYILDGVNFGLTLRPTNKLVLQKHVTGMKITTTGQSTTALVDTKLKDKNGEIVEFDDGMKAGLRGFYASRTKKGRWSLETDIEELLQGAEIKVTYTYTIVRQGDQDYLSTNLNGLYNSNIGTIGKYAEELTKFSNERPLNGTYLGQYYYTGSIGDTKPVSVTVEKIEDYYEHLEKEDSKTTEDLIFEADLKDKENNLLNKDFNVSDNKLKKRAYLNAETTVNEEYIINKVVQSVDRNQLTGIYAEDVEEKLIPTKTIDDNKDSIAEKTIVASKVLSAFNAENSLDFESYNAQIMEYSSAAGRRDMDSAPGNLDYVYSERSEITLDGDVGHCEDDEYWAETVTITKPTGEDKISAIEITIIATSSLAVIAVGIIVIKKFVISKKK